MAELRTTHTPDPNHPIKPARTKAAKKVTAKDFSKSIVQQDGLWHAYYFWNDPATNLDEDQVSLGTFGTELLAERAVEDAVVRAIYYTENLEADDEIREEAAKAEEDRISAEDERQTAARGVAEHKFVEPKAPTAAARKAEEEAAHAQAAPPK